MKPPLIDNWDVDTAFISDRGTGETLLAWHEFVAVVDIPLAAVPHCSKADVMMRSQQQACPIAFKPLANRVDFGRSASCSATR